MRCLKQGGVSLIGQRRFLTQEQCRKSFLRRNKNPHINERVHAVRALQSTLKVGPRSPPNPTNVPCPGVAPPKRALAPGRRSWRSCRPWSSCWERPRSPRTRSGAGRRSTRSCTRSCGRAGQGGRARATTRGMLGTSTAPTKRQLNPDILPGPGVDWCRQDLERGSTVGALCWGGLETFWKAQPPAGPSRRGSGFCDSLNFSQFVLPWLQVGKGEIFLGNVPPLWCCQPAWPWALLL